MMGTTFPHFCHRTQLARVTILTSANADEHKWNLCGAFQLGIRMWYGRSVRITIISKERKINTKQNSGSHATRWTPFNMSESALISVHKPRHKLHTTKQFTTLFGR